MVVRSVLAMMLICSAYALLAGALQTLELSVAYATWGGLGIMGTALAGQYCFNQRLTRLGWVGIIVVIIAVVVLNTSWQ
jgi:spermidine export protein MdtI